MWTMRLVETNLLPDRLIRAFVRRQVAAATARRCAIPPEQRQRDLAALVDKFRSSPIALQPEAANRQHYEVPAAFFRHILGRWLKYSGCYWPGGVITLDQAEEAMLRLTCARARLQDGMDVLDLGCGWGALSLWVASHYPDCRVTALSNALPQKLFIDKRCRALGLDNVKTIAADINTFTSDRRFDRVISVEMFEHMKNYEALLANIAGWLKPGGKLFVHLFSHREVPFEFELGTGNWMAEYFFTGGTMPSHDLLTRFQRDLTLAESWRIDGTHYARTLHAWLDKLDRRTDDVRPILAATYGPDQATRWLVYWRLFFIVCEETFALGGGQEYGVSHYLFEQP